MISNKKGICVDCGDEELMAVVTLDISMMLSKRGTTVKVGGVKVHQMMLKEAWEAQGMVRGPITCISCGAVHFQVMDGEDIHYFLGDAEEARELIAEIGVAAFLEE